MNREDGTAKDEPRNQNEQKPLPVQGATHSESSSPGRPKTKTGGTSVSPVYRNTSRMRPKPAYAAAVSVRLRNTRRRPTSGRPIRASINPPGAGTASAEVMRA